MTSCDELQPGTSTALRAASLADIPAITAIYRQAVLTGTASFEIEPPDEAEMSKRWRSLRDGAYPYLVAEADGTILGYAYAGPYRLRPAYRWTVEDSIYVAPQAHRRGIGRALLERLVSECETRDFRQMIAVIGDSRQIPSIALHSAVGFRLIGTFEAVGFKFERWLDTVLMQRAIGPGADVPP